MKPFPQPLAILACYLATVSAIAATAPLAIDEQSPWPRVRSTNGNTVTIHLPQVERWTSNSFSARAAVEVKFAKAKSDLVGVVWFEAHGSVDRSNRLVTLDGFEITRARFPGAPDNGSNALALTRAVIPAGARTVSLDYLVTALGFVQAAARQGPRGLKHDPPDIIWTTNRSVLVILKGDPTLRPIPGSTLMRVLNTPALMVRDGPGGKFYLSGDGRWFVAESVQDPWSPAPNPPPAVATLSPAPAQEASAQQDEVSPRIIVSTRPAELLQTLGLPDFRPIRGTALQYAANTDSQLFFDSSAREVYLLISGRWFKAKSLNGPWSHVNPRDLPADFARIPPGSPQAIVLASVPGMPQAELAVLAGSVPTTATVNRLSATNQIAYDGEPKFKGIEGTRLSYALNAPVPVIQSGESYYALDNGVWFHASSPQGPWEAAAEIPDEIYSIPPDSPVYYATFTRIYDADDDEVEVGYTEGYLGVYEDDGTMVYGTGCEYDSWCGDEYYDWGWTWGYSYAYVPWYQWWVWYPWWHPPGGLRAALIDNIYDRWQGRPQVTPHDRSAGAGGRAASATAFSGHPALYGRYKASARPTALALPQNTLALNPYSRPQTATRPGDVPRGASLLTSVRESPSGGRDLYASPDGNIYRRKNDGWYRRETGGKWSFYAPTQGRIESNPLPAQRGGQSAGAGGVYRPTAGGGVANAQRPAAGSRMPDRPDAGGEVRAQEVAQLEREYYARSLAQIRAQNSYSRGNYSRPVRSGGGGRR